MGDSINTSNSQLVKAPNVVIIGGGTGTYTALLGLKQFPLNLTAVVTSMDSGGSTGRLRDQLGVLPPGDFRQALVALSDSSQIWRDLFTYRFDSGDLDGHNFGNIFISALQKITGSFESALYHAASILDVKGSVLPVTLRDAQLCVKLDDDTELEGEARIDIAQDKRAPIRYAFLRPEAPANPRVIEAIQAADYIIVGPGDLYTSIICNIIVNSISESIINSPAKKIYIVNLMTKLGQTDAFTAASHVRELERYLTSNIFDAVLINSRQPDPALLEWYLKSSDSDIVTDDLDTLPYKNLHIVRTDLLSETKYEKSLSDRLKRSLIRHDSDKLGKALFRVIDNGVLK